MAKLYYQVAQENATKRMIEDMKKKLKASETNTKEFSETMDSMQEKLKELEGYPRSEKLKFNTCALIVQSPWEAAEVLFIDKTVEWPVIQGFFDSLATYRLLSEPIVWVMQVGA